MTIIFISTCITSFPLILTHNCFLFSMHFYQTVTNINSPKLSTCLLVSLRLRSSPSSPGELQSFTVVTLMTLWLPPPSLCTVRHFYCLPLSLSLCLRFYFQLHRLDRFTIHYTNLFTQNSPQIILITSYFLSCNPYSSINLLSI